MSLATTLISTRARALAAAAFVAGLPPRFAARVSGVDLFTAREMQLWLLRDLAPEAEVPALYADGQNALCFAILQVSMEKPLQFWLGLVALPCVPVAIFLRWVF